MTNHRVAARYAKSLIELAQERKQLDGIKSDVDSLLTMAENREFALLLSSPVVNPAKKKAILATLLDRAEADELTKAFVRLLIEKGREKDLVGILKEFVAQYKVINHISTVKLTSATPLSGEVLESVKQQLIAGGKTEKNIDLHTAIDPAIMGGFILEFDGNVYDASVAHKLKQMKKELQRPNLYQNKVGDQPA
jgi:F-type H+-transporting ATPase subunit delta